MTWELTVSTSFANVNESEIPRTSATSASEPSGIMVTSLNVERVHWCCQVITKLRDFSSDAAVFVPTTVNVVDPKAFKASPYDTASAWILISITGAPAVSKVT